MKELIIPFWLITCKGLNSSEKLVLACIVYLNPDNITGILLGDIMGMLGMSRPILRKTLERLKDKGILKIIRKSDGSIYSILWKNLCRNAFGLTEKTIRDNEEYIRFLPKTFVLPEEAKYEKLTLPLYKGTTNINISRLISFLLLLLRNKPKEEINHRSAALRDKPGSRLLRRDKISSHGWYDNLIKAKEPLPERKPPASVPLKVKSVIQYWKFCGLRVPKETSKTFRRDIAEVKRLLAGKLFSGEDHRPYSVMEIKQAITDFSGAALDSRYEPADKDVKARLAKYYLNTFIINQHARKVGYSMFLKYLKESPREIEPIIKDVYPAVTDIIRKFYYKRVVGKTPKEISQHDENCFRKATKRLMEFIKSKDIRACMYESPAESARMLCDCTLKRAGNDKSIVTPGWFCSDHTFDIALPAYFKAQGMYEEERESSIYDRQYEEDDL